MAFSVIEPHPSVPKTKKAALSTGRGGAGNFSVHDSSTLTSGPTASGPAFRIQVPNKELQSTDKKSSKQPSSTVMPTEPRPSVSSTKSKSSTPKAYSSGIGGAGNFHTASDRRIFSFDEELERAQQIEKARNGVPVYHFGRGGAGNLASSVTDRTSSTGSGNGRAGSTTSSGTDSSTESRGPRRALGSWIRGLSGSRE